MITLIVEDDFRIADMYKEYLTNHTSINKVMTANNAAQCLDRLKHETDIELILMDIYLPDLLGDELMEAIIKKYPYIDFIVITASQEGEHFKKMMRLGAKYYLVKPVKLEKLANTVNDYITKNKLIEAAHEIDQSKVDEYFGSVKKTNQEPILPKGIDPVTLKAIEDAFSKEYQWTSLQLGEYLGTSRTTVRRYLEYLRKAGKLEVTQVYGDKGRPEKTYILK